MCDKSKERESLVWNGTAPTRGLPGHGWARIQFIEKGHEWVQFCTKISLSFKFSCIMFVRAKFKGRERESLGTSLGVVDLNHHSAFHTTTQAYS